MSKQKTLPDDLIYGRDNIAEVLETEPPCVTRLWARGCVPVVRIDRGYMANRAALLAAKEEARRRGESWAQRELIEEIA